MSVKQTLQLAVLVGSVVLAQPAFAAQFETPSRQFHNQTAFPLEGQHRAVACESCHVRGVYKGTPNRCFDCHWQRRQDDRFRLQLGSRCEQCHRPAAWTAVTWNHGSMTGMPLSAPHQQMSCQSCHTSSTVRAGAAACVSCHLQDYQATQTPNHVAAGFPTTCDNCHRPGDPSFRGAGVNHAAVFPLVGQHARQTCAACHVNNMYRATPRDCVGCHRTLYDRTTAPNHVAAGFPTTCESCHRAGDTSFSQGTFNHRFPITSGPHRRTCETCHRTPSLQTFTCLVCHEHDRTRMDDKHKERAGYRYDSLACYSCHPTGRH